MDKQFNVRIPEHTDSQIDWLLKKTGMTKTQLLIVMADRFYLTIREEEVMEKIGTLEEAVQAKRENKVVLADWSGRRVTINDFVQNESTGEWSAKWTQSHDGDSHWDVVSNDELFIIRGEYSRYR